MTINFYNHIKDEDKNEGISCRIKRTINFPRCIGCPKRRIMHFCL